METNTNPTSANPGRCGGCGEVFRGARGLRAHQSQRWLSLACRPLVTAASVVEPQAADVTDTLN